MLTEVMKLQHLYYKNGNKNTNLLIWLKNLTENHTGKFYTMQDS